jgi:hypothetical protein
MTRLPLGSNIPPVLPGSSLSDSGCPSARCKACNPNSPESVASLEPMLETAGHISDIITEYPHPCIHTYTHKTHVPNNALASKMRIIPSFSSSSCATDEWCETKSARNLPKEIRKIEKWLRS